ncbi:MAG: hypothetical protein IPP36_11355 [Nitrosomonadales bacterium]|nr:hypothetical protein [Nitrosomonadales bacterium]
MAFVKSDWHGGIEPWQFNLPDSSYQEPYTVHTVFDRTLLRAGEIAYETLFSQAHH